MAPKARQTRQQVLELGQLDLKLALASASAMGKDVQDQCGTIQNFAVEYFLEVSALRRGKFVVKNNGIDICVMAMFRKFLGLALADKRGCAGRGHLLDPFTYDLSPGGCGEFG